jgi:6-phosphogluconolactonase (cycloisomerase 2 family)
MTQAERLRITRIIVLLGIAVVLTVLVAKAGQQLGSEKDLRPTGYPQLVSVEPLPETEMGGAICAEVPAGSPALLAANIGVERLEWQEAQKRQQQLLAKSASAATTDRRTAVVLNRPPARVIRDPFPTYSAVAVDPKNNEIVLQDENLFQLMVYDRMTNTSPNARFSEPKRVITGHDTKVEFNCAIYIDPKTGDLYSVNNDTLDTMTVFSHNQSGNAHPARELSTPHRTYGIAVDEVHEEMFLTVQDPPMLAVYNKYAKGDDKPVRVLRGNHTGLEDPHGVGLDTKNGWMFVANYGNVAAHPDGGGNNLPGRGYGEMLPGSGRYEPPSITVYPLDARGDTPPLRVIEGTNTELNWPAHISVDQEHGEVYVANDGTDAILVFRVTDSGNVSPTRVLKGPKTQIKNPTGVFVDTVNNELVVANMGNHRATVYSRAAEGDTPPIRTIRTAPNGTPALQIGNPGAVAYDTKRDEILVPN